MTVVGGVTSPVDQIAGDPADKDNLAKSGTKNKNKHKTRMTHKARKQAGQQSSWPRMLITRSQEATQKRTEVEREQTQPILNKTKETVKTKPIVVDWVTTSYNLWSQQ